MFFPAAVPPPHRSPTITTRPQLAPSPNCPRCNTALPASPRPTALLSPLQVQTARFGESTAAASSSKFKHEELDTWKHLCGLDVPEEEQELELEQAKAKDEEEDDDDGSDYDDSKPYAALVNSPSPPTSPVIATKQPTKPTITPEERVQRRQRREEWQAIVHNESQREKELRLALEAALSSLDELTRTNSQLQSTHQDLEANLKIARSNLALAEANTEMLEESIKRGDAFSGRSPSALGLGFGHQRAGSTATVTTAKPSTSTGFWNRFKDSPSESTPRSPTQILASQNGVGAGGVQLQRSNSYSTLPSPTAPTTAAMHAKAITALKSELAELKKSKAALEDELENLSQALFEEANKMVADERKKLAEREEECREAREERDALRRTIQVLGGSSAPVDDEVAPTPESIPLPPPTPPRQSSPSPPNPWATGAEADTMKQSPSNLVIPPPDQRLPSLDRPRTPAEDLDGLIQEMQGEFGK